MIIQQITKYRCDMISPEKERQYREKKEKAESIHFKAKTGRLMGVMIE